MISELKDPASNSDFMRILTAYEQELHRIDGHYPEGRTATYLDVEGIRTFVHRSGKSIDGFITVEYREGECEIHELYVCPKSRNGIVLRKLLKCVGFGKQPVIFNIFCTNRRCLGYANLLIREKDMKAEITENEVWGVSSLLYRIP